MSQYSRAFTLYGAKKPLQDLGFGAQQTSQKVWNSLSGNEGPSSQNAFSSVYAEEADSDAYWMPQVAAVAAQHSATTSTYNSPWSQTTHTPPFTLPPSQVPHMATMRSASRTRSVQSMRNLLSAPPPDNQLHTTNTQPHFYPDPKPHAAPIPDHLPTSPPVPMKQQAEHVLLLPKTLGDSDNEVEIALTSTHFAHPLRSTQPSHTNSRKSQNPKKPAHSYPGAHAPPVQRPRRPSFHNFRPQLPLTKNLSHTALPFVPSVVGLAHVISTPGDLYEAITQSTSVQQMHMLLRSYSHLLNGPCIIAGIQRLQAMDPKRALPEDFHAVASQLVRSSLKHRSQMSVDNIVSVIAGACAMQLPLEGDLAALLAHSSSLASSASVISLITLATLPTKNGQGSKGVPVDGGNAGRLPPPLAATHAATAIANALAMRLSHMSTQELHVLPPHLLPAIASALAAQGSPAPELLKLKHATLASLPSVSPTDLIAMMSSFVDQRVEDPIFYETLNRAFHDNQAAWDTSSACSFLGACRAHKQCLAAQRQSGTLAAVLAYLRPRVALCETHNLCTAVLDMAFIGTYRGNLVLPAISNELAVRTQNDSLTPSLTHELADVLKALDKLDHRNEKLSRAAGVVLADASLPAKNMANAVVSLAKHKLLAPSLADAARHLLQHELHTCNGQDVSQILFGLMLDKQGARRTRTVFTSIAPQLADHLRTSTCYQAQSVSRILSSYAKVGCYSPVVFDGGVKCLSNNLTGLKPAFICELAWSLSVAGQAQPQFMERIAVTMKRRFQEFSPNMLCTTLWAFANAQSFHPDLFNMTCGKLANLLGRNQVSQQDIQQAMYGVAHSHFRHATFLHAIHDWLVRSHADTPVIALPPLLWGLQTFRLASESLLLTNMPRFIAEMQSFPQSERTKLVQLAYAYAAAPNAHLFTDLFSAVEQRLLQTGVAGKKLSATDMSLLAWSFGHSQYDANVNLVEQLAVDGASSLEQFTPQELVHFVWGICNTGHYSADLLRQAEHTLLACVDSLDIPQLSQLLNAYSHVGCQAPTLFHAAARIVEAKVARGGVSAEHATQLALAYSVQGSPATQLIQSLCAVVQEDMASRSDESYHLHRPGRALSAADRVHLHMVRMLSGHSCEEPLARSAAQSYKTLLAQMKSAQSGCGGDRALQAAHQALQTISSSVTTTVPEHLHRAADDKASLFDLVDVWAEVDGQLTAVVLLGPKHCLRTNPERCHGWMQASIDSLKKTLPRVIIFPWHRMADLDHDSVLQHLQAELSQPSVAQSQN